MIEAEDQVGGISKTKLFKGYRFDLGGHRFFTKSEEVNALWDKTLGKDFLTRPRLSRMYYKKKFFDYPIKPFNALAGLGLWEDFLIGISFMKAKLLPYKDESTFDRYITNRFGARLYRHFFKSYTEKLWGIPCEQIQAEFAAQRIKGLSIISILVNAVFPDKSGKIKTLIEEFKYPKHGPGMMYDKMAEDVKKAGANILMEQKVVKLKHDDNKVTSAVIKNRQGKETEVTADYYLSSMPLTSLIMALSPKAPEKVLKAAQKLSYRSFVTISVILKAEDPFPDTWIYVHEPEVKMGRIQNFRAWSPFMVPNKDHIALGLEYFCTEGDEFWNKSDEELMEIGMTELEKTGLGKKSSFVDGFVIRVPKTYPVYDLDYPKHVKVIREYLANFENLQPIGRYGMFKYNNMDHSIITGLYAAENILGLAKHNIWDVNADLEYHEEEKEEEKVAV
jgi:protoporphyrinogen oxidase